LSSSNITDATEPFPENYELIPLKTKKAPFCLKGAFLNFNIIYLTGSIGNFFIVFLTI